MTESKDGHDENHNLWMANLYFDSNVADEIFPKSGKFSPRMLDLQSQVQDA